MGNYLTRPHQNTLPKPSANDSQTATVSRQINKNKARSPKRIRTATPWRKYLNQEPSTDSLKETGWKIIAKCRPTGIYNHYYYSPKTAKKFRSAKKAKIYNQIVEDFHGSEDDAYAYFKKHELTFQKQDWKVKCPKTSLKVNSILPKSKVSGKRSLSITASKENVGLHTESPLKKQRTALGSSVALKKSKGVVKRKLVALTEKGKLSQKVREFSSKKKRREPFKAGGRTKVTVKQAPLKSKQIKAHWAAQEEKALIKAYIRHGPNAWEKIMPKVPSKSFCQCRYKIRALRNSNRLPAPALKKKEKWTKIERCRLDEAMQIFGPRKGMGIQSCNWLSIAVRVKTKTAEQCFKKWESTLPVQCGARRFNWRADECKRLLQAILRYGNNWERIAKYVKTRTAYQCRRRRENTFHR